MLGIHKHRRLEECKLLESVRLCLWQSDSRSVDLLKLAQNLSLQYLLAFLTTHCARPFALLYSVNASVVLNFKMRLLFWFFFFIVLLQSSFQYGTTCLLRTFWGFTLKTPNRRPNIKLNLKTTVTYHNSIGYFLLHPIIRVTLVAIMQPVHSLTDPNNCFGVKCNVCWCLLNNTNKSDLLAE